MVGKTAARTLTLPRRFAHFLAIDWSGAKGERHKGIALARCDAAGNAPRLLWNAHHWSRADVLHLLRHELPDNTLVGMDLGISLPFADAQAFFPGWNHSPPDARSLWALVDDICHADAHLGVSSFVDHDMASRYFRRPGQQVGDHFYLAGTTHKRGRFRVTENAQAQIGCNPYSNFNLIGAAQVGKSSLSGMRVLHRLDRVPVWPIDPLPQGGSLIVEIYTGLAAIQAGRTAARSKMKDHASLNAALNSLDCPPVMDTGPIDDHSSDAILTSAWLRKMAENQALWTPTGLSSKIARTEGWTFGAV